MQTTCEDAACVVRHRRSEGLEDCVGCPALLRGYSPRYRVMYLGQRLGEIHWGVFDIEMNRFLERDGIKDAYTERSKAKEIVDELNGEPNV